jgi:hypothetical protein
MKTSIARRPLRVGMLALLAISAFAVSVGAQSVSGVAFGSSVKTALSSTSSPVATLPAAGGYALGSAESYAVPNVVDARWLSAVTTGGTTENPNPGGSSQSVSELEAVSILNGVIRADNVTAIASSFARGGKAGSNAAGSGFSNLVVNGVSIATEVAPNTRIDLPGVGYVVLNQQSTGGNGVSSSSITVNMIHAYLLSGGEIIVGSSSSSVAP